MSEHAIIKALESFQRKACNMLVKLSELKTNPSRYFNLAKTADIIVTRHGQRLGRIVCEEEAARTEKQRAIEALIGSVRFPPEYGDPSYDPDYERLREAAYKDRGLLQGWSRLHSFPRREVYQSKNSGRGHTPSRTG
jgi:hypothetical protein